MELLLPFGTALLLGLLHALEPDHVAAVSSFVVRRPTPRKALGYGVRWAAGHGGAVMLAGSILIALHLRLPDIAGIWLERLVGLSLVLLGGWVAWTARSLRAHRHTHRDGTTHAHLHAHVGPAPHEHGHAATAIGALHGLAGTAPAIALVPLASFDSPLFATGYLATFAIGTAVAMGLYAMFAGVIAGRAAIRSEKLARGLARLAGVGTIAVGVFWLLR